MKCDEVRRLHSPYLDSELDAKTTLDVERHLASCPACTRRFAEEQKLDARLMAGLNRGPRTSALWEQLEREVVAPAESSRRRQSAHSFQGEDSADYRRRLLDWMRAGWQQSHWAWAGLAAAWVVILALNFAGRETDAPLVARQELPSASEVRFAVKQQQLLMAELAVTTEPVPVDKPKAVPPSPRSDRGLGILNA
jgi:anti-sigma factor RsiW